MKAKPSRANHSCNIDGAMDSKPSKTVTRQKRGTHQLRLASCQNPSQKKLQENVSITRLQKVYHMNRQNRNLDTKDWIFSN